MSNHQSRRFLITGCGRSGTKYISQLINNAGCACSHERSSKRGTACWFCCKLFDRNLNWKQPVTRCGCRYEGVHVTRSGSVVSNETRKLDDYYDVILHQVRHPLNVIASTQTILNSTFDYIDNKLGTRHYPNNVLRATRYWIDWNMRAKELADFSYRIEEIEVHWPEILDKLGMVETDFSIDSLPRNINTRTHTNILSDDIQSMDRMLFDELQTIAAEFGYYI